MTPYSTPGAQGCVVDEESGIAEQEREALPDFRTHVNGDVRNQPGAHWLEFSAQHAAGSGLSLEQKDVDAYIDRNE